ncbi:MAG: MFS transporter [bacterium]
MVGNRSGAAAVIANRSFVVFAVTQAVSLMGDKVNYMALLGLFAWLAARGGPAASRSIALITLAAALPAIIFAPFAGVIADRADRRKLMLTCDAARLVLVGLVPAAVLATGSLPVVVGLALAIFFGGLVFNSARNAVLPTLAGADTELGEAPARLVAANSFMSLTGRAATIGGMLLGGMLVDWSGWQNIGVRPAWAAGFYLDALTYLVALVGIVFAWRRLGARPASPPATVTAARHTWADLAEAWRFARQAPPVLFVYGSVLVLVAISSAFLILYVPIIQDGAGLDLGTRGVGFTAAIGAAGLLLSSAWYGLVGSRFPREVAILAGLLLLGGIGTALPFARSFALVAPLAFVAGLALTPVYVAMDTLLHETVPPAARGRVFANRDWLTHLTLAASALATGMLAGRCSSRRLLLGVSLLVILLAALGLLFGSRVLRRYGAERKAA